MTASPTPVLDALVREAPSLVLCSCAVSLVDFWFGFISEPLVYGLAATIGLIAISIGLVKVMPGSMEPTQRFGFRRNRDYIYYEIGYRGIDDNYYALVCALFVSLLMSGFERANMVLLAAAAVLSGTWASATRKWPKDEPSAVSETPPPTDDVDR